MGKNFRYVPQVTHDIRYANFHHTRTRSIALYDNSFTEFHQNLPVNVESLCKYLLKAVPLQAWSGPEGSRKLRFPDFMTTARDGGKVSLTHRPPLPPGNTPGTHFC